MASWTRRLLGVAAFVGCAAAAATQGTGIAPPGTGTLMPPRHLEGVTGAGVPLSCKGASCVPDCPGKGCTTLKGAVGDCATDDSLAFVRSNAAATAARKPLYVPAPRGGCYVLTPSRSQHARIHLTTSIVGQVGAYPTLKMVGARGRDWPAGEAIVQIEIVKGPLLVAGLHLTGERPLADGGFDGSELHKGWAFSHCITMTAVSDVTVQDNFLDSCLGDGVYIGGGDVPYASVNSNILVNANTIRNNARQQISIIDTTRDPSRPGVAILNNRIDSMWGYGGALDIEPNRRVNYVYNVEFAYNVVNQTPHTPGWNGTATNWDSARKAGGGGNLYAHHNLPGSTGGWGKGYCVNRPRWNPIFTNVHVCEGPGF